MPLLVSMWAAAFLNEPELLNVAEFYVALTTYWTRVFKSHRDRNHHLF